MELTSTRKKANAITSSILNRIAIRGQRKVADALGINESQISRWKGDFIPKMGMLLAVLEWGVEDEELAELAKKVAHLLTKEKPQDCGNSFRAQFKSSINQRHSDIHHLSEYTEEPGWDFIIKDNALLEALPGAAYWISWINTNTSKNKLTKCLPC